MQRQTNRYPTSSSLLTLVVILLASSPVTAQPGAFGEPDKPRGESLVSTDSLNVDSQRSDAVGSSDIETADESSLAEEGLDMFAAIEQQLVDVRFIPLGPDEANVIIENRGEQPIALELPKAFGAVHVAGQFAGPGGLGPGGLGPGGLGPGGGLGPRGGFGAPGLNAGMGFGGGGGLGGGQNLGGGFGQGGMNNGFGNGFQGNFGGGNAGWGNGLPGGLMRIEPDRPRKLKVTTVCLEHGKPDPRPRMTYQLVPIERVTGDPRLHTLCTQLGSGELPRSVAQAAAWHLASGLSWRELAVKNRRQSQYLGNERYFTRNDLRAAHHFVTSQRASVDYP